MKSNLVIIGAGGHGKVIADLAVQLGCYSNIIFLDDNTKKKSVLNFDVVGCSDTATHYVKEYEFMIAIGNSQIREKMQTTLTANGATFATLIHPNSYVSKSAKIEAGSIIMAGAVIQPDVVIEAGTIVNTSASVDHDCIVKAFSHVAVGAHIAGKVNIGKRCWIGAGAVVSNDINISDDVTIGAGAVVIKDISASGIYVGVPAHLL